MSKENINPAEAVMNMLTSDFGQNALTLQIIKGLQGIPIVGGFIADYKGGQVPVEEIRQKMQKAYDHINELSAAERNKLNSISNQVSELGTLIGSPALMSFARKRSQLLQDKYNEAEKKLDKLNQVKEHLTNTSDDYLNSTDVERLRGSNLHQSLEKAYENSMNLKGDTENV